MTIEEVIKRVRAMRAAQRTFYAPHHESNHLQLLTAAREAERQVDRAIREWDNQGNLFAAEQEPRTAA